eukprot:Rhum_TRINITY_DN14516_c27_g1::Rhum_TRINITY_DN14516_c27_g1_i1::g.94662::m.94662
MAGEREGERGRRALCTDAPPTLLMIVQYRERHASLLAAGGTTLFPLQRGKRERTSYRFDLRHGAPIVAYAHCVHVHACGRTPSLSRAGRQNRRRHINVGRPLRLQLQPRRRLRRPLSHPRGCRHPRPRHCRSHLASHRRLPQRRHHLPHVRRRRRQHRHHQRRAHHRPPVVRGCVGVRRQRVYRAHVHQRQQLAAAVARPRRGGQLALRAPPRGGVAQLPQAHHRGREVPPPADDPFKPWHVAGQTQHHKVLHHAAVPGTGHPIHLFLLRRLCHPPRVRLARTAKRRPQLRRRRRRGHGRAVRRVFL